MKYKLTALLLIFLLNCSIQNKTVTKPARKPLMIHPKTYYNQYRPKKYSPFENYIDPSQTINRGVQYKKKKNTNG